MFLIVKIVIITTRRLFIIIKTEADVNSRASCVRLSASTRTWCCQFVWPDCVLYCVANQSPKLRKKIPKRNLTHSMRSKSQRPARAEGTFNSRLALKSSVEKQQTHQSVQHILTAKRSCCSETFLKYLTFQHASTHKSPTRSN